jgi:hypothetical protein
MLSLTFSDLLITAGFLAYLVFYILSLTFFKFRLMKAGRSLKIINIILSVAFAMVSSTVVFMILSSVFVEGNV